MKRGQTVAPESLVKLIPHLLITVLLLAIIFSLYQSFFAKAKTPAEQDFQRILSEVDELIAKPFLEPDCIRVPIQAKSALNIVTYPSTYPNLPARCQKNACICLYATKEGGQYTETCKPYPSISAPCRGDTLKACMSSSQRPILREGDSVVTIERSLDGLIIGGSDVPCTGGRLPNALT